MNDNYVFKILIRFLILIFGFTIFFIGSDLVYATCYQCNDNPNLINSNKSGKCNAGWHETSECNCFIRGCGTTVTATFDANGGALNGNSTASCIYYPKIGTACEIDTPTAYRSDATFLGWSIDKDCGAYAKPTKTVSLKENTKFYACYKETDCWKCLDGTGYVLSQARPSMGYGYYDDGGRLKSNCFNVSSSACGPGFEDVPVPRSQCSGGSNNNENPQNPDNPTIPEPEPVPEPKKCSISEPTNGGNLECNGSKTFKSICNELTVETDNGRADVKIEQMGYISSVLTPTETYAGSGFSFGVMYTNTIKWTYVGDKPNDTLHSQIVKNMNSKLKNYDSYISGLNLTEISFGGKVIDSSFLVKKCSYLNDDFYNNELTVSCIFYIPDSILSDSGDVNYKKGTDVNIGGISNKYYTPLDYNGNYKIKAKIVGMDRITETATKGDSSSGKAWTGTWSDTFENCEIDVYSLFYAKSTSTIGINYNLGFIYRPIDINNPFPNRNAGINWFDWYSAQKNRERLESTYERGSNLQYTVTLNNNSIVDIKNYNKNHNYLEWDSINENTEKSSFISDKDYIDRVGGTQ